MIPDILVRRQTKFVLWRPGKTDPAPTLRIGARGLKAEAFQTVPLQPSADWPELWEVLAADCHLIEGTVYHYWFQVQSTDVYSNANTILYCTDPLATSVDDSFTAGLPTDIPAGKQGYASMDPAAIILFKQGKLIPCDIDGVPVTWREDSTPKDRPSNNRLVAYELPTRWSHTDMLGNLQVGTGTFQDVLALVEVDTSSPTFPNDPVFTNRAHLQELGINALELLPPEDSDSDPAGWHYGTAHFFAADYTLAYRNGNTVPRPSQSLAQLIESCHDHKIRFFLDAVMAFCVNMPYRDIDFLDFLIKHDSNDPEEAGRDGFGGDLLKYNYKVNGYDPITGQRQDLFPSRQLMKAHLYHWMTYYRIDGVRIDSVNNINNPEFVQEFKDYGRALWKKQRGGTDDQFLVVGEELSVPIALLTENRLDGLWNEDFKRIARQVLLGRTWGQTSFEASVRTLIDCRMLGFQDGAQAVNYLTSHDVGGPGNERIVNWLWNNGVADAEGRLRLAFVCLLTAVGIPMILAGDEFANQQHLILDERTEQGRRNKQIDPVDWTGLSRDPWRMRLFQYVSRLVSLRTTSDALSTNDIRFLHSDFTQGKRVMVWQRGNVAQGHDPVVVVANFSDWGTANAGKDPNAEYQVPGWPATPPGKAWQEVTQNRDVPEGWIGREPLYPWEAKVYTLKQKPM